MPHLHSQSNNHTKHRGQLAIISATAATIAAPYVLPALGIGTKVDMLNVTQTCSSARGGLAQAIEGMLSSVPVIGGYIGTAGWSSALIAGGIGIAGIALGNYVHKHYDRKGHIPWGKVIKYTALATSMLIAMPSILSGVSMGIAYIASVAAGNAGLAAARAFLEPTIGFSGVAHTAPTGLAGLAPHLLTCGRALVPAGLALASNKREHKNAYECRLLKPTLPLKGQPTELSFQLIDTATGRPLQADELQILHTRPLHTMIVDSSLRDYHHLHPEYDASRNCFTCRFTPNLQSKYTLWNDFTVKGEKASTHTRTEMGLARGMGLPARIGHTSRIQHPNMQIDIITSEPLRKGRPATLTLEVRDSFGNPITDLEPIMGAYAHLAAFSADGKTFLHTHPMGEEPTNANARGTSPLKFHLTPEREGPNQFFLQIQRGGQIQTIRFGQLVAESRDKYASSAAIRNTLTMLPALNHSR